LTIFGLIAGVRVTSRDLLFAVIACMVGAIIAVVWSADPWPLCVCGFGGCLAGIAVSAWIAEDARS
jgi:hypothetical protein